MIEAVSNRLNSPWAVVAATAVPYFLFLLLMLHALNWDPSLFVRASEDVADRSQIPKGLTLTAPSTSYDGFNYYRLALDPFTSKKTDYGIRLDFPAYRQQRIMYPLIVWALSAGRPERVPSVMILVNYLGLCVIAWLGARIAQSVGRHAFWGMAFPFYPGFILTLSRDLTEIVEAGFLLAALLLLGRRRQIAATVCMCLAVLTRESALLVVVAAAVVWCFQTWKGPRRERLAWHFFVFPSLAYGLWHLYVTAHFGRLSLRIGRHFFAFPLQGLFGFLRHRVFEFLDASVFVLWFFEASFLIALGLAVACSWRSSAVSRHVKVSWLLYAVMFLFLNRFMWCEDWNFLRVLSEFYLLGAMALVASPSTLKVGIFGGCAVVWLAAAIARVYGM